MGVELLAAFGRSTCANQLSLLLSRNTTFELCAGHFCVFEMIGVAGGEECLRGLIIWTHIRSAAILTIMTPREAIDPIIERIRDLPIVRVVVFGSTARGENDADSDLDLAIIVPDPTDGSRFDRVEAAVTVRRRILDINRQVAVDILVYTESEFQELSKQPSFVRGELVESGEVVYERAG